MKIISSMATRALLAELADAAGQALELAVSVESVGGVDATKRVRAGEAFDAVVLASDVIDALIAEGHALPGSRVDLVRSEVAVAVPAGAPVPDIASAAALRQAMLAAPSLGYSTGPSGNALLRYIDSWGLSETLRPRLVQAPAGVPVGTLVARGEVALGFQQLSELIHVAGITLAGPMPADAPIVTVFSGAVCQTAPAPQTAAQVLAWMAQPATAQAKQRQGMAPA
jgi:molybdate transport system substrate-binding protein